MAVGLGLVGISAVLFGSEESELLGTSSVIVLLGALTVRDARTKEDLLTQRATGGLRAGKPYVRPVIGWALVAFGLFLLLALPRSPIPGLAFLGVGIAIVRRWLWTVEHWSRQTAPDRPPSDPQVERDSSR